MYEHLPAIDLDGHSLSLHDAYDIALGKKVCIAPQTKKRICLSRQFIEDVVQGSEPIYGVNTGFGYFAKTPISKKALKELQLNLLKSHASGYGDPLSQEETRLAMALRLNVLVKGFTGVRWELCQQLCRLIQEQIYPIIPEYGSVGASGDLAPLAHLALPLTGHGKVFYQGRMMSASRALKKANIPPLEIHAKEGLSLINGTQIMLAVGSFALAQAEQLLLKADKIAALSFEALEGVPDAYHPKLHQVRNQKGQIETAKTLRQELKGSSLLRKNRVHPRIQDPYSLRCIPQVHGASKDTFAFTKGIIEKELNAITDNPLVFLEEERVVSGGNFHGQYLAMSLDAASMAIAELGNISERRLELLLNPHFSGLNAFLSPKEGIHSGYMATQYLSASLVNQNKIHAHPACTDSIPGNVGVEDHVSMGMTSANKFKHIVKNLKVILSTEYLSAAQAIDLRDRKHLGQRTQKTYELLREKVPFLKKDRIVSEDVEKAVDVLESLQ